MAKLVYTAITSLDGFIEDADGRFDWAVPDAEVHEFVNALEQPIGTHLYGRRRALDKVVYSRTLDAVWTPRTSLERELEAESVRLMKESGERDISILHERRFANGVVYLHRRTVSPDP
jgi:hypothetical protein